MRHTTTESGLEARVRSEINALCEALAGDDITALLAYLRVMAQFHQYSYWNVVLIRWQRPDATRVAGRQTWKKLKRRIISGDRGIEIMVPNLPQWAFRLPPAKKVRLEVNGFHPGNVFDVSDTEGEPLPEFPAASANLGPYLDAVRRAVAASGIALKYVQRLSGDDRLPSGDTIELLTGATPCEEFVALTRRYAKQLLRRQTKSGSPYRPMVDSQAEAVAFLVGCVVGLDMAAVRADYHPLYSSGPDLFRGSLGRIQRTARDLLRKVGAETLGF